MLKKAGEYGYLLFETFGNLKYIFSDFKRVLYQLEHVGYKSIPIILVIGFFAGSITAWQAAYQFRGLASLTLLGGQTTKVIVMEMGPVLTALVIAGRVGASMTAEIGSMKITEQVDALKTMAISPNRYIVMPRFVSLVLMLPVLTIFANILAVFGAFAVSNFFLDIQAHVFTNSINNFFELKDFFGGLFKSLVFGIVISSLSCYFGISTTGGAVGVGKSTIASFVTSAVAILILDYCLWLILF